MGGGSAEFPGQSPQPRPVLYAFAVHKISLEPSPGQRDPKWSPPPTNSPQVVQRDAETRISAKSHMVEGQQRSLAVLCLAGRGWRTPARSRPSSKPPPIPRPPAAPAPALEKPLQSRLRGSVGRSQPHTHRVCPLLSELHGLGSTKQSLI